ncbi:MAG TPA: glutamate-1-semialdehyde 2,1-aminomutase [Vicinamibacterales bacterium]|nr:glutamate-1-semialdehyde 2,1-aminomutase [Vicinamibacterales bacterium]
MSQHVQDSGVAASSRALFARAERLMPGGVNSPVRAFRAVGGSPRFIERAAGARIYDVDGREYIDYIGAWGPLLLGHAHPAIVSAITAQAAQGTAYGAPTRQEVEMAEAIVRAVPSIEMVRMVNSGTEATMAAVRVARGVTGRNVVLKFAGCYHGHGDSFLVKAGSGAATFGTPDSPGVTEGTARDTVTAHYNDVEEVRRVFREHAGRIAAVIVEPVAGNMGLVPPRPGFLEALRELCTADGALLIFDEVITGFRLGRGGAQERYGVMPDLTALGKIIGGGLPVGAYGGRSDLMRQVSPAGPIYQAGTLSGNPLAMAAGLAALSEIEKDEGLYGRLDALGAKLEEGVTSFIRRRGLPCRFVRLASMWTLFFRDGDVRDWRDASSCDTTRFARYFRALLDRGTLVAPSQFETNFISAAHAPADIETTVAAISEALEAAYA